MRLIFRFLCDSLWLYRLLIQEGNPDGIAYPVKSDEKYVEFTLVAQNGLPLEQSHRAVISAVATSFNSGFRLDESKLKNEFVWQNNPGATPNLGRAPVLTARVEAVVELPSAMNGMNWTFYDFNLKPIASGTLTKNVLRIPAPLPVFYVGLTRP